MSNSPIVPNAALAQSFLEFLHPLAEEGFLGITAFPGPRTCFYDLTKPTAAADAARQACALASHCNVYFGIGTQGQIPKQGRGASAGVVSIPGGWVDIDIRHLVHAAKDLPPDEASALWIPDQFSAPPSILVKTGHGYQAFWLTTQAWKLTTDKERDAAKRFSEALQAKLRAIAARRSWRLDNTSDLARLLRLPGTLNLKDPGEPKLVTFTHFGHRYALDELLRAVDADAAHGTTVVMAPVETPGSQLDINADGDLTAPVEVGSLHEGSDGSEGFVAGGSFPEQSRKGGFDGSEGFVAGGPFPEQSRKGGFDGSEGFVAGGPFPKEAVGNGPQGSDNRGDADGPSPNGSANSPSGETAGGVPPKGSGAAGEAFPPADIRPIVQRCAWMRHCHNDAPVLSEPEWYAMLTILGRCKTGEALAHRWSRPYPKYSQNETRKKLEHAIRDSGPITCQFVAERLGQFQLCSVCPHWGVVSSPIVLGGPGRNATSEEAWPTPQPLTAALPDVAVFEPRLLPPVLRDHVMDVAERLQVPADFPAATMTVSLAGGIGRRAAITPMQHDKSWVVIPNLWGGLVGRPGLMKSPCIRAVMAPLFRLQSQAMQQHKVDLEDYQRELEAWEARKASWKKKAISGMGSDMFDEAKPEKPACARFIVNDATVEKLHEILEENPQGVLYIRDELAGWFATLDTKGRERDRPFFLESWNGDGSYTVDRIGRGTLHVEHLCLSIFGGIQPSRLQRYLTDAVTGGATDDGLAQRLQVLVWPDHNQEWHHVDRPPNIDAAIAVEQMFQRITKMLIIDPFRARFAPDAQELFNVWRAELERRIRRATMGPTLESHLAKYRKLMPALALIFHLAEGGESPQVSLLQAQRAAAWCDYLESHARRVYSCVTSLSNRLAAELGSKLKQGLLGGQFRLRDVYLRGWAGLDTPDAARMALTVLEDAGWVRRIDPKSGPQGGRPKEEFLVNPKVWHG